MIGVQQKFFERPRVSDEILGHLTQGAVSLVHVLHLSVAPLEDGDALEHDQSMTTKENEKKTKQHFTRGRGFQIHFSGGWSRRGWGGEGVGQDHRSSS